MLQTVPPSLSRPSHGFKRGRVSRQALPVETLEERCLLSVVPTATTLSASSRSVIFGQSVALTATLSPARSGVGTASGKLDFLDLTAHTDPGTARDADFADVLHTGCMGFQHWTSLGIAIFLHQSSE